MKKVIIYTTNYCPYCVKAKSLLTRKNISFEEVEIKDDKTREEMVTKSNGRRTVPQIFIGDFHVGGCDDLYELERQKKLDDLI